MKKSYLETVMGCGGYYECPKDDTGKRLGPLVGYTGKDEQGRQKVGDVYVNFAKAEQWPHIIAGLSSSLAYRLNFVLGGLPFGVLLGMPMGGIALAQALGSQMISASREISDQRAIFAEKKGDELVIVRHDLEPGDRVLIVEDICNNFSTTDKAVKLIEAAKAKTVAITCFLNRSNQTEYEMADANVACGTSDRLPVISLIHHPFPQYTQDDPEVAADIAAGNVVWKPKLEWSKLQAAMKAVK